MLIYAKFRLQKDSNFMKRVSKFKLFAVLWSRQPSGVEHFRKRSPKDAANRRKTSASLRERPKCRPGASDGLQIAKFCKCLQKSAKFSKLMLKSAKLC